MTQSTQPNAAPTEAEVKAAAAAAAKAQKDAASAAAKEQKAIAAAAAKVEKEAKALAVKAEKEAKAAEKAAAEAADKAAAEAAAVEKAAADKAAAETAAADAKAKKEADAAAKKQAAAEKAKAALEAKEAKAAEKLANKMPLQNGIRRPAPAGECGKVWGFADLISSKLGSPAPIADVLAMSASEGVNPATTRTQYARWRVFHGIVGRIVRAVPVAEAAPVEEQRHEGSDPRSADRREDQPA